MKSIQQCAEEGYFGPLGEILLSCGQEYHPRSSSLDTWSDISGEKGMCFRNCTEAALRYRELTYVEGYAIADIAIQLPLAHAWLLSPQGEVLDPTWSGGLQYFGIAFSNEDLFRYLEINRQYGILQSLWANHELRQQFCQDQDIAPALLA